METAPTIKLTTKLKVIISIKPLLDGVVGLVGLVLTSVFGLSICFF